MNYQELISPITGLVEVIYEPTIGYIPLDKGNADYQAYLQWVAEKT